MRATISLASLISFVVPAVAFGVASGNARAARAAGAADTASATVRTAPVPPPRQPEDESPPETPPPPAVYGLFSLWEHTGAVEESGAARVGMRHAQVGLGPLTVGTDPYLDLYGTLNAGAKLGLLRRGRVRLALQVGYTRVPTAAETRGIGNLHATGFANPYAPVVLIPVAAGATFVVLPQLHLHASATVLRTLSAEAESRTLSAGVSTWVEWWASPARSVRLHTGVEGWPVGTQEHVGISFAWRARHAALQAGYARRFAAEGTSSNSIMFDGAVLFP
ncbi:MAG: hypothetical protein ABUS79_03040 [Pseudomonadota bacterium]